MVSEQVVLGILIPPEIHRRRRPPQAARRRIHALRAANSPFCSRPSRLACGSGRRRPIFIPVQELCRLSRRPRPVLVRAIPRPCPAPALALVRRPSAPPPICASAGRRLRASLHARLRPSAVVAAPASSAAARAPVAPRLAAGLRPSSVQSRQREQPPPGSVLLLCWCCCCASALLCCWCLCSALLVFCRKEKGCSSWDSPTSVIRWGSGQLIRRGAPLPLAWAFGRKGGP